MDEAITFLVAASHNSISTDNGLIFLREVKELSLLQGMVKLGPNKVE
jgi:hypothetical protein